MLADTPPLLFQTIAESIDEVRDPHARHWLIYGPPATQIGFANFGDEACGVASHYQEVQLRSFSNSHGGR
jgi:hypothetical protein